MKRICFTILSVPSVPLPSFATLSFSSPSLYDPSVFLLSFASICFSLSILSVPSLPLLSFSALSFSLPLCQFLLYPSFHLLHSPFLLAIQNEEPNRDCVGPAPYVAGPGLKSQSGCYLRVFRGTTQPFRANQICRQPCPSHLFPAFIY